MPKISIKFFKNIKHKVETPKIKDILKVYKKMKIFYQEKKKI